MTIASRALTSMRKLPRFALSSQLLGTAFTAVAIAVSMKFGAFGLLLSAFLVLALLTLAALSHLMTSRRSRVSAFEQSALRLMVAYCMLVAFYFASYGPATWVLATTHTYDSRSPESVALHFRLYSPVTRCIVDSPLQIIRTVGIGYLRWWLPPDVDLLYRGRNIDLVSHSRLNPTSGMVYGLEAPLIPNS